MRRIFASQRQPTAEELAQGPWSPMATAAPYGDDQPLSSERWPSARAAGALQATAIPLRLIVGTDDPIAGAAMLNATGSWCHGPMSSNCRAWATIRKSRRRIRYCAPMKTFAPDARDRCLPRTTSLRTLFADGQSGAFINGP